METVLKSLIYAVLLFLGLVILAAVGLIDASFALITGFVLVLYGLMSFVLLSGTKKTRLQFISAVIFYAGIVLFLSEYAYLHLGTEHILPALLGIGAFSCLMVFLEEGASRVYGIAGFLLLAAGIALYFFFGEMSAVSVLRLIFKLLREAWLFLLVLVLFIYYAAEKKR